MNDRDERFFELLDPPPGGLKRLRSRIDGDRRRRRTFRLAWSAAAAMLLIAAAASLSLSIPAGKQESDPRFLRARIHLGLLPPPAEPVTVPQGDRLRTAVQRIEGDDERVVFYRVASLETGNPSIDNK
jgi:hypothetical protein